MSCSMSLCATARPMGYIRAQGLYHHASSRPRIVTFPTIPTLIALVHQTFTSSISPHSFEGFPIKRYFEVTITYHSYQSYQSYRPSRVVKLTNKLPKFSKLPIANGSKEGPGYDSLTHAPQTQPCVGSKCQRHRVLMAAGSSILYYLP